VPAEQKTSRGSLALPAGERDNALLEEGIARLQSDLASQAAVIGRLSADLASRDESLALAGVRGSGRDDLSAAGGAQQVDDDTPGRTREPHR
jgi:hypothetical protein